MALAYEIRIVRELIRDGEAHECSAGQVKVE